MKKFKFIAYLISIIIMIILSVTIYSSIAKSEEVDEKDKTVSEIKYLEERLVYIANTINNIESDNYSIKIGELQTDNKEESTDSKSSETGENQENGETQKGESSQKENSNTSEQSASQSGSSENAQDKKKYELQFSGILTQDKEVNWDTIKSEIEIIYASIPTITMDLYKVNINQDNILEFNREYDNLTIIVKDKKKEETLSQIAKLYSYIAEFIKNTEESNFVKKTIETKSYLLMAYSKLESEDWNEIGNNINKAIETYSALLSDTNIDNNKQHTVSKCYVMLNELKNAINVKDREVFLIKYKNLIQELSKL